VVDAEHYQGLFRGFKDQRIIIVGMPLAGTRDAVIRFRALGSDRCLVVATVQGRARFQTRMTPN
jgi:hypothetical protein